MSNRERVQRRSLLEPDIDSKPPPRENRYSHRKTDSFTSRIPTATPKNGEKSRLTFTQTRTLTGAFEATADRPSALEKSKQALPTSAIAENGRRSPAALAANQVPTPPNEEPDAYRPVSNAGVLSERGNQANFDHSTRRERLEQLRNFSPSPGARQYDMMRGNDPGDPDDSESSLEDYTDEELLKRTIQRRKDDERLKRVKGGENPVFSKARVGSRANLSTGNLQRRDEEIQRKETPPETIDEGRNPPLNIPRTWGTRSRATSDWLNRTQPESGNYGEDAEEQRLPHDWENDAFELTGRSIQVSNSPPVRKKVQREAPDSKTLGSPPSHTQPWDLPLKQRKTEVRRDNVVTEPPAVVQRNTCRERPRTISQEDSHDLLRRLARKESPSLSNTPESKVTAKTPLDPKTPIVTGAWVDTPLPTRSNGPRVEKAVSALPEQPPMECPGNENVSEAPLSEPQVGKAQPSPKKVQRKVIPAQLEKPNLPKSALAAIIESVHFGDGELEMGETTIESLQKMVEDSSSSSFESRDIKKPERIDLNALGHIERKEQDTEEALIDRLNLKLQSLVRNINQAKAGLVSLEDKAVKESALLTTRNAKDPSEKRRRSHDSGTCDSCGLHDDGRRYIAIPVPRFTRRHPDTGRRQLTRLSWLIVFVLIWQIVELFIDEYRYSPAFLNKPHYMASRDPEWPIFIPHTIWRWLHLSAIWIPIRNAMFACVKFVGTSLGVWDPFYDDWMYGEELYGENWIQRYNPLVYPELFRNPVVRANYMPGRTDGPVFGGGFPSGRGDPDLSMDGDAIL